MQKTTINQNFVASQSKNIYFWFLLAWSTIIISISLVLIPLLVLLSYFFFFLARSCSIALCLLLLSPVSVSDSISEKISACLLLTSKKGHRKKDRKTSWTVLKLVSDLILSDYIMILKIEIKSRFICLSSRRLPISGRNMSFILHSLAHERKKPEESQKKASQNEFLILWKCDKVKEPSYDN